MEGGPGDGGQRSSCGERKEQKNSDFFGFRKSASLFWNTQSLQPVHLTPNYKLFCSIGWG